MVTVDITTSVKEKIVEEVVIYPNPAGDIVNGQLSIC